MTSSSSSSFNSDDTPYVRLGGRAPVERLAATFYDVMEQREAALTALHARDASGDRVSQEVRERFALFLVGWLGGPQEYMARHGHPRLRMRHAHVRVDIAMRDAWLRCMEEAMRQCEVEDTLHNYLMDRFTQVADFMRNVAEEERQG